MGKGSHGFAFIAFTFLLISTVTRGQDDYDAELLPSAKGEAEPYPPSPPPPPNPGEEIPVTEGPETVDQCPNPNEPVEGAYLSTFYEGYPHHPYDRLTMYVQPDCTNIPEVKTHPPGRNPWTVVVSDMLIPSGKCIRLFKEPNCCGDFIDMAHNSPAPHILNAHFNDLTKSFRDVPCDSPPPSHPSDCTPIEKDSFLAVFYEGFIPHSGWDSLGLEVSSCCRNLPDAETQQQHNSGSWRKVVSDIHIPDGKCIRVYDELDCGGRSLDYAFDNPKVLDSWFLFDSGWNDRLQSFLAIPCEKALLPCQEIPEGSSDGNTEAFSATFFEGRMDDRHYHRRITLDVSATCANVPTDKTGSDRNTQWNQDITDVEVPQSKCICLFEQPDCGGASFYMTFRGGPGHLINNNFNDKTQSFRACNMGLTQD